MNEGETLRAWLRANNITVEDFAAKMGVSRPASYDQFKKVVLSRNIKLKLTGAGYDWPTIKREASKLERTDHDKAWLIEQVEKLYALGIIKEQIEIAKSTGYIKSTVTRYLDPKDLAPSQNFIQSFMEVYGRILKIKYAPSVIDETVMLTGGKKLSLELPPDMTKPDWDIVLKWAAKKREG